MNHQPAQVKLISGVVVIRDGKILLNREPDDKAWQTPGGKVDLDESVIEGAIREVKEETGFDAKITDEEPYVITISRTADDGILKFYVLYHFKAEIIGSHEVPKAFEHMTKWFPIHELPEEIQPNVALVLQHYIENDLI